MSTLRLKRTPEQEQLLFYKLASPECREEKDEQYSNRDVSVQDRACVETILMVEDDEFLRDTASEMLRRNGFSVIEAADGEAAISTFLAHQRDIQIVLLHLVLQAICRAKVFEERNRIRQGVNVIFTTSLTQEMAVTML